MWKYILPLLSLSLWADDRIQLQPAWAKLDSPKIDRPISVVVPPDGTARNFLVMQRGKIIILPEDQAATQAEVFLDLTDFGMEAPDGKFEEGLLGLAFHPDYKTNRKFYVAHSAQDMKRSVYAEYCTKADDPSHADLASRRVLLEVPLPYWNHHSGNIAFGPDGFLYITLGDGGGKPGGDPLRTAQNPFMLNGKVLRIDVNRQQGNRAYGIPEDNPYVGQNAARHEVWAIGMRNPWGISFDQAGHLWLADVGQELAEEINIVTKGGNYGWSFREGMGNYPARTDAPAEGTVFVDPIHVYDHTHGISITGGFVYRGKQHPELVGTYIYGDWAFGTTWALRYDFEAKKVVSNTQLLGMQVDPKVKSKVATFKPAAYCEDAQHEILALDWNGAIWRMTPKP
jgi:glucose/arabinose dehydrogenase